MKPTEVADGITKGVETLPGLPKPTPDAGEAEAKALVAMIVKDGSRGPEYVRNAMPKAPATPKEIKDITDMRNLGAELKAAGDNFDARQAVVDSYKNILPPGGKVTAVNVTEDKTDVTITINWKDPRGGITTPITMTTKNQG